MFPSRACLMLALAAALGSASCRSCSNGPDGADADEGGAVSPADSLGLIVDASNRFRDAEPKVEIGPGAFPGKIDPEGPIDPACSGPEIALAAAVVDKRCAIGSARAKQLRAILEREAGVLHVRQEAKVGADGRITLRVVNTGTAPLTLPLSFAAKLPAFTVLAEDERHVLYELEPPRFDVAPAGADDRAHFARIVLPPSGAAVATLTITPVAVRVLGPGGDRCADASRADASRGDASGCPPSRLAKGRYVLHIGELLTDVEVGAPARVAAWELP